MSIMQLYPLTFESRSEQDYLSSADVFLEKIDARFICWEAMSVLLKVVVFQMMMIRTV